MSNMAKNELTVGKFTLLGSTNTTSITFSKITSLSTASTQLNFDNQTIYFDSGVIHDLSTVTSTFVLST